MQSILQQIKSSTLFLITTLAPIIELQSNYLLFLWLWSIVFLWGALNWQSSAELCNRINFTLSILNKIGTFHNCFHFWIMFKMLRLRLYSLNTQQVCCKSLNRFAANHSTGLLQIIQQVCRKSLNRSAANHSTGLLQITQQVCCKSLNRFAANHSTGLLQITQQACCKSLNRFAANHSTGLLQITQQVCCKQHFDTL